MMGYLGRRKLALFRMIGPFAKLGMFDASVMFVHRGPSPAFGRD
jgi:hypothetical protein